MPSQTPVQGSRAGLHITVYRTGWMGGGVGLWSFHFWKHCVTLISVDTVFSPLSVSLIRTCSPLGRAGLCKVTSWQSMLTWKYSEDVNRLGKLERDFSGDERDKKEGCWQARIQSLVLFCYFYIQLQHVSRFKKTLVFQDYTFTFRLLNNIYMYILKHVFFHSITIY